MLLPPNPNVQLSTVFSGLYALLQEVLRASCAGRAVRHDAMPAGLWTAAQTNKTTKAKVNKLIKAVKALPENERYELWLLTWSAPKVRELMTDSTQPIPAPPAQLITPLKALVVHLFDRTSKLVGVGAACGESLHDFFHRYAANKPVGNGNVCGVCGTDVLAQRRHGVPAEEQWRAAFDHLLAEARYPLIALDPVNLLPVCYHCNSKAKLAKDLLHDEQGNRRICFDPWTECAHGLINVTVSLAGLAPEVEVAFASTSPAQSQKLSTWDTVYQIRSRVRGAFSSLAVILAGDLKLDNLQEFQSSMVESAGTFANLARAEPYNYWRSLLYQEMMKLSQRQLEQIRATCQAGLQNASGGFAMQFGI